MIGRKEFKTVCLIFVWICIGLNLEITGPTLKDLMIITNTNYEDVSRALSGRAFGFFIGSAAGGFLVEKFDSYCDLMIALGLDFIGAFGIIIPYLTSTSWMFFLVLLQGTFEGIINIAGQTLMLEMWKDKAASPMNALHLGFGIGSLVVPQIVDPFLAVSNPQAQNLNNITTNHFSTIFHLNATNLSTETISIKTTSFGYSNTTAAPPVIFDKKTSIKWPYLIVAVAAFVASIWFFIFQLKETSSRNNTYIMKPKPKTETYKLFKIIDPKTCTGDSRIYGIQIFAFLFLFCFQSFGGEYVCGKFIRSYAIDVFDMSSEEASWLNTCFWISYSFGCFLGFVVGRCVPIRRLLLLDCTGLCISAILMAIYARYSAKCLWIFVQFVGAFIAPSFALCVVWGDYHVQITGFALTVILFGASIGGIFYLWIVGHLYDTLGPDVFPYSCAIFGGLLFMLAILLHIVSMKRGSRFEKKKELPNIEELEMQNKSV